MMVCGIDPALTGDTGLVFYDTETGRVFATHIRMSKKPGFPPLAEFTKIIEKYIQKYKPDIVGIEQPFVYRGRINGAMRVFYLHALLRYIVFKRNALLYEYPPKSWKKRFTGSGDSGKSATKWAAISRYRRIFYSHDEADAFGIMHTALSDYQKDYSCVS
jgi:Holliday junction resolvasome RuvABC endonuclease subunit